jgi:chromosome segregation ATPase
MFFLLIFDFYSSWTSQNLTLENQLHRLSRQVAEETAEKRKILEANENLIEKIKQLEFESMKIKDELKQRDNKVSRKTTKHLTILTPRLHHIN